MKLKRIMLKEEGFDNDCVLYECIPEKCTE